MAGPARKRLTFGKRLKDSDDTQIELYSILRKKSAVPQQISRPQGSGSAAPSGSSGGGDNLGNHIATTQLLMRNFPVRQVDYIEFTSPNTTINDITTGPGKGIRHNVAEGQSHDFRVSLIYEMIISEAFIDVGHGGVVRKNIINCKDPINPQDVATKAYVDRLFGASDPNTISISITEYMIETVTVGDATPADFDKSETLSETVAILLNSTPSANLTKLNSFSETTNVTVT